jgi:TonB-dependent receptor
MYSTKWVSILFVTLLFIAGAKQSPAQGQTGAITGKITDPSGAVLKGALVSTSTGNVNVVSNEQGLFLINGLAPGRYTLAISYVGFATFQKTLEVAAGQTMNVDATLEVQSENQTVLVTAPRATAEAEAINVERTSDNIVQVLPAEVIRSLPNANMADALGRLPSVTLERDEGEGKYVQVRGTEPRLTNTTVNGVNLPSPEPGVRQIKFDAIPADIVESVQISKTLQANMDGDGIGGSVNLVTKTATSSFPAISLSGMGGYTPIVNGRGLTEETGTIGKRFGANERFGVLIGGSYDWNGRGIDDIEPVPDVATFSNGTTVPWKDGMDIREYRYFRSRWGLAGTVDYKLGQGSDVYFRWLYSDFKNYGDRWAYTLVDNTPGIQLLAPSNDGCGSGSGVTAAPCTAAPSFNAQLRNPDIGAGSMMLGGTHVLTTSWYSWDLSASRSFYGNSPYSTAVYNSTLSSSACQYDPSNTANVYLPRWTAACYTEAYNPSNLVLNNINRGLGHSAQLNLQATGATAKRYHIGSRPAIVEIGGKFRNEHKFADTYVLTLTPNGSIPLSTFPNRLVNTNYYNGGNYNLGYNATYEDAIAYANAHPSAFTSSSTFGQDPSEYDLIEKVSAGYVMNTIDLSGRLRFVGGVRFEATSDSVANFSLGSFTCPPPTTGTCSSITPNRFTGSYLTVLPSASLRYAVTANNYLRFVYARGLSRPDPQDIAQALDWTVAGNGANRYSVSFGNANLKAETGDDADVLFEHYLNPFGVISAGYFYKYLQNPIITRTFEFANYQPPGGPLGNYLATQPVNAGSAWITGFEGAYLQHFSSLPGAWGGLGLSANYGYTASRTTGIPGRSDHPRLLRMSPNAFNISPTYDRGRVSIRVGLSYNQASIYSYQYTDGTPGGINGPLSDIYFYSHFQVDAQGSIRLGHGLNFVMYGLNLNNAVFGFYQGSAPYMIQREYYQPTVAAGFRWSPPRRES